MSETQSSLQSKLDVALKHQWGKLSPRRYERSVYCWRRYLSNLKGFKTISLNLLISNIGVFSDHVVVVDPSSSLGNGPDSRKRFIVADREFAIKCVCVGLPDISSMTFKKPRDWDMHDQLGLEFELPLEQTLP